MTGPYDDLLYLPHHQSKRHPPMPNSERAAQFSPFAALTGHGEAMAETAETALETVENEIQHVPLEDAES